MNSMPPNLLDQLRQDPIPAPPKRLRGGVRERVNSTLTVLQVTDLVVRGLPFVLTHLAQALGGFLAYTLTGTYEPRVRDDARK
jgi:hypothetical protein